MTSAEQSRQQRAAETKRRRTRERLITAAAQALSEEGWDATVEDISGRAGISTATFYTFYGSRYLVCMDAFTELVIVPAENAGMQMKPFSETASHITLTAQPHALLLRAAMVGRLESSIGWIAPHPHLRVVRAGRRRLELEGRHDFVDRLARLLADDKVVDRNNDDQAIILALTSAALRLLDGIIRSETLDIRLLAVSTLAAARLRKSALQTNLENTGMPLGERRMLEKNADKDEWWVPLHHP